MHTLHLALRLLLRQPAFAGLVVLTLAVGVGVATLVFGIYLGTMVATPSFTTRGDRIVFLEHYRISNPDTEIWGMSEAGFLEMSRSCPAVERTALVQSRTMILSGEGTEDERILGNWITAGGLGALGIAPKVGRVFEPEDGVPGQWNVMVIGHDLWRRRYGADPEVVGREEVVNGERVTIIGVMPAGFDFVRRAEAWMPFRHDADRKLEHGAFGLDAFALLAEGASLEDLNGQLAGMIDRLREEVPDVYRPVGLRAFPVAAYTVRGESRSSMHLLLGAMVLVLLITTATVANLTLARMGGRLREFATRAALGASRGRLVGLVLAESLWLGLAGGVLGFLVGWWGVDLVRGTLPPDVPNWLDLGNGPRSALAALALAVGAALTCGLLLGLRVTGEDLWSDLRDGGRTVTAGRSLARLRSALVVAQVAIAATLLVGAGLCVRSYHNLQREDRGFRPEGVHTFRVGLPPTQYTDAARVEAFFSGLERGLPGIPGVEAGALVTSLPGSAIGDIWQPADAEEPGEGETPAYAFVLGVSPGYFAAMDIPILEGRDFLMEEPATDLVPVVASKAFVEKFLGGGAGLGAPLPPSRVTIDKAGAKAVIVGIVGNASPVAGLDASKQPVLLYKPLAAGRPFFASGVVRTSADPAEVMDRVRMLVRSLEPGIPIYNVEPLTRVLEAQLWGGRLFGGLFATFGGLALVLAMLGIYGVLSHSVVQRTPEIGLRCALGAAPREVFLWIAGIGARLIGTGIAIGLVAAILLVRYLELLLFQVSPRDPLTFAAITLLLLACGALACLVPALRALRIPPAITMRADAA